MFQNEDLKNHLETTSTIRSQPAVFAEWNMNIAENISLVGNYRYRPALGPTSKFGTALGSFDPTDAGAFYTGATDADIVIDGGLDDSDMPLAFLSIKEKEKLFYSLEDCFGKFRPRSGINKLRYFPNGFSHHTNINMSRRPRYYMAHRDDTFKYWSSYRTEEGVERGIANNQLNGQYYIQDASPFVVYKDVVPANRIVLKMQTGVGEVDLGSFSNGSRTFSDPFFGYANQTTPVKWRVQILKSNNWIDVASFNSSSLRRDGTNIIGPDGYVELSYGLIVPERYRDIFIKAEEYFTETFLPEKSVNGYAYLIKDNEEDVGTFHIWVSELDDYQTFVPQYGWYLEEGPVDRLTNFVTDLTSPILFNDSINGIPKYREFEEISGIRLVVDTMNKVDSILDLIEMSPRLAVSLTEKTEGFDLKKTASDLGASGMPVGQLLAGVGSITLFDYDQALSSTNTSSIVNRYLSSNVQFKFYEVIVDVDGFDYFVPLKTMYSESMPDQSSNDRSVKIDLRDLFFYFESQNAPQIMIQNASVSYAVSLLLDSIGFSNYVFKRAANESESIIPIFYTSPDKSIAEVLNDIAVSTQTAVFFDEYNNLILMSKEYMLPSPGVRPTDITLYGTKDFKSEAALSNKTTSSNLANIISISSKQDSVFNDGSISYTSRSLQRRYSSFEQSQRNDMGKTWVYEAAVLWESVASESTKSLNEKAQDQGEYTLSAIPLNSDLSDVVPFVRNGVIQNNVIDFGESANWMSRYNGYFYSNGEVIKYDAVEFEIPGSEVLRLERTRDGRVVSESTTSGKIGKVWITNQREYTKYFSQISFNGKMYPTGKVRIYTEPNYVVVNGVEKLAEGAVAKHGRAQFGTKVVYHHAGLNAYWSDNDNVRGCTMQSSLLFEGKTTASTERGPAGVSNVVAKNSTRTGIIKNFLTYNPSYENISRSVAAPGSVQSSAFVFTGPSFSTTQKPVDFISYVYKPLTDKFKHFGTRMRIIGTQVAETPNYQNPLGAAAAYQSVSGDPSKASNINLSSGGVAVMINPENNNGYYFEIAALNENNIALYENADSIHNVLFYKVLKDKNGGSQAVPVKLWGGLAKIIVDDGKFTGQYRQFGEENPTVHDLAVEYQDVGSKRKFYLYINNKLIATVEDEDPLPIYNNMALFVRGSARVMFENVYAIANNYSQNTVYALDTPVNEVFSNDQIDMNESFRKYAMSGVIQASYLSGISPSEPPKYNMYFEEFGTIMREAAYVNIRYDKAYPALSAQLSPTFNRIKGYTTSGFIASAYGAEFMVFNATDTLLSLDGSTGNYLRIQGVTFTQESTNTLTVDEYFSKRADYSNPTFSQGELTSSPVKSKKDYQDIKASRLTSGKKEFSLSAPYIQNQEDAENLMEWMTTKIMKPRRSVGLEVFGMPIIQLGDLVQISFKSDDVDQIANENSQFVVYNVEYSNSEKGPDMKIYLSEVA